MAALRRSERGGHHPTMGADEGMGVRVIAGVILGVVLLIVDCVSRRLRASASQRAASRSLVRVGLALALTVAIAMVAMRFEAAREVLFGVALVGSGYVMGRLAAGSWLFAAILAVAIGVITWHYRSYFVLDEGDVYSVVIGSTTRGDDYGIIKVVSLEGAGCIVTYGDDFKERPTSLPAPGRPFGYYRTKDVRDGWNEFAPQEIPDASITAAEVRYCERTKPDTRSRAEKCREPVDVDVALSPVEECQLELLRQRCDSRDACLILCMARGSANVGDDLMVAGGCFHLCGTRSWTPPDGWDECEGRGR